MIFINVGQGDSTLIRYKNKNILIDTGGSNYSNLAEDCLIPFFNKLKINSIDLLLATHNDYDHIGAYEKLKDNFSVKEYYNNGDRKEFFISDLKISDLHKYKDPKKDENYNSSIFQFKIKDTSFLIMGDAPIEVEKKLIIDYPNLKADVIKIGHHGSNTSSSYEFLKHVSPKKAVISCGYNNFYSHPHKEVISNLDKLNISYYRTDLEGSYFYKV